MRGLDNQLKVNERVQIPFIDLFKDKLSNNGPIPAPVDEPMPLGDSVSLSEQWYSGQLNSTISYYFLDDVAFGHPLLRDFIQTFLADQTVHNDVKKMLTSIHRRLQGVFSESSLQARTLMNLELAVIYSFFEMHQLSLPDVHAFDAWTLFNDFEYGLAWPEADGWRQLAMNGNQILPFDMNEFASIELSGPSPMTIYPHGERRAQNYQVIDMNHDQVISIVNDLFKDGFNGLSLNAILQVIRKHMQGYEYIVESRHEWQSLNTIFINNGGDCEDLAHLEASLILRALTDAGFHDVAESLELLTGYVGKGARQIGHTIIQLFLDGQAYVIDSTMSDGPLLGALYRSFFGFEQIISYGLMATSDTLAQARRIDTKSLTDFVDGLSDLNDENRAKTDILKERFLSGLGMTNYAKTAVAFYDAVTNENINSTFWNANNADAQALAAEQMQSIPAPTYQALDAQTTVYVGKDVKRYDTRDGLAGLMEINYNRMQEMSDNLTSNSLNKYVGQLYNGYFIYDYSRIMGDYTEIMNAIQMATCFLTAQMTYANSFNWIGSQLSYDNEPNSEVKARQRFVKNVQNSLLKMVDEIEYFIPLFTQTYDDLNQGTYGKYQQEVVMKFQNINSSIKDIFELGSETIMRNQLSERVELEWAVVNMMLREKVMQSEVIMPNSRALASYVNFSTPYSDLLNTDPGSPASFANFASQMELDIEAGVYKPVQTSNNQVLYISALQYYFSYYYHDAPGDIQGYTTAEGPTDSDSREPIAGNDFKRFIDKSLGSVYSAVGLTAMEENNTFYDYPDWVKNVVIDSSQNGDYDTYKAGDNTPITTENYKLTSLYKYIHSKGAKYHERFENEGYTTGDDGKIYAASITNGKWQATPKAKVQYKERKRRLHAYDFTDILEYTANGSKVSGTNPTSKSVWDDLISKGYIDQYGNFNQKFVNKMIGSSAANLVNDLGLSNFNDVNNEIKTAIGQRMYNTCPIDEYQYGIIEYDFTRPQLFTRGSSSLKTNGYLDPYAGESISSGWQFLTDYFSGGPSAAMSAAMAQTTATIGESANSQTIPVPTFADFNVTKWGLMASQNVSMIGGNGEPQQFSVEEVRSYLYNETGDKFWSDLTITKEQQKKFYMKSLNTDSSGNPLTPSGYTNGRGKSYQGLFSCHDFVNQTASNPDDVNTQALASPMIGTPSEDVGAVAQPVLPSPSLSYDYDYGAMTKLPYDDRIVTLSNESLFPNQGGIPLGEIQWVYNEDKSADLSNPDNNNMKGIYSSVFNDLPTDDLNKIRLKNSLEKPLTPGYSYNDQNTVFSASQMAGWLNMNRQSDTFRDLISAMISKDYIIPTFQRIESGNNQGYYSLMGYTITEKYVSAANFNDLPSIDGINEQQVVIDLRNDHINGALTSAWKSGSFDQMAKFLYSGRDQFNSGFLDNDDRKYQLLRWTGQTVDGPILGMNSPMPFMSYDWHAIKAAHNGMVSIQNRVRLFYFISQAYISSIQSVNKRLDGLASSGIFGIEADSQLFEKRVAKQTEQLAQVSAKTSQFVELNNAFYKQQINTIKASDVGIRVAKGVALYGDLAAAPMYLAAVPLYAAAPADPSGNTLFWANFFYFFAAGLQVASMIGELTEKSINLAHTYGIPQKMTPLLYADTLSSDQAESSSLIEQARQTFKRMTQYKSPISFNNGDKWTTNGVPNDYDLKRIYDNFSPLKNTEYLYVNEALGQDVWQGYSELEESKKGDCEDYAMLAASLASASSSYSGQLRVVNGLIGYGGNAPRSHTVLLYDPGNDPFAIQNAPTPFESKKVFKNANTIQVIDLTSPLKNERDFYTLEEYQALYGYFQPVYSYDKPNETTANTGYGFEDYEIFGYTPSAASPGPPLPGPQTGKGPINFSGLSDGTYTYNIDQNSTRPVMTIYSGGSLVQTRTLTAKIEFGKKQYKTTDPTGKSVTLDLPPQNYESDDQIDPVENEGQVEGNVNSKLSSSGGISFNKSSMDLGKAGSGFSATDSAVPYASSAVFPQISGGSGSGSIWGSDIVTNQMQEIITLEMEEHALLNEMFTLAVDEDSRIDASKNDLGFAVYDWPAFQQLQRRLFVVQTKMKKMFLIMKLRSEFYSLIGTRLGDFERQQVGSAMDSIFNAHFSQVQNSVESIQSLMMSMQSARQSNFDIDKQREQAIWDLAFKTPMNIVMGLISFKPIDGVFWTAFTKGMLGVLNKVIVFFGAPRNDYYLKSTQELRESSLMANPSGTLSSIQSLYNLQNSSSSYDEWDSPIYSSSGKIAYSKESLESGETLTTQEIYNRQVDTKYSLTVNDVVDNYWKTNKKGYYTPSIKDSYFGNMRDYSNNTVAANNFTQKSLEDHVMEWMTTRYFPESGDELMFLDSVVYSMAGTKMASDIQFFDWIQNRLCAEMMRQIIFSMYTSTLKSLAANLGHGQNGGNDAISMSTSLTGDVGQHYFHLQTTLSTWEQAQIQVANRRFAGYKELDSIILEGIIAVGTAALTAGLSGLAEAASGFSQIFLQLFSGLTLVSLQIVGQLTQLIYQSVDANEKNQVLEDLSKEPDSDSEDVSLDKDNEDYNMTDAQRTKRRIRAERDAVGAETLKTAGNASTGFASTYVDQQVKVKMKRQVQELFKQLEVQQTMSDSYAEYYKQIASNLGYSTSQANVSGGISRIQGLAKSAEDKAVDTKFSMLEAAAKRENEIHGAAKGAIMAATEVVMTGIVKAVGNRRKEKLAKNKDAGTASKGTKKSSFDEDTLDSLMEIISSTGSAMLQALIAGAGAKDLREDRNEREAENKSGKTDAVDAVGDAASSDRGQQLTGLEQRALNAQFNLGANQEMQQINQVLQDTLATIGKAWGGVMKQIVQFAGKEMAKFAKEMASEESVKAENEIAANQKAAGNPPTTGSVTPDAIDKITDAMKDAQNEVNIDPKINEAAANKKIAENQSSVSNDVDATKEVGTPDKQGGDKEQTNQQLNEQAEDAIEAAENADKQNPIKNAIEAMKDGKLVDLSGMSFKDIQKLVRISDQLGKGGQKISMSPLRRKAYREMILQIMGVRRFSNAVKELNKADDVTSFGIGLGKVLGTGLVMLASPLLANVYKKMMEDFSGESDAEKAEKLKENAVARSLIAHNAGDNSPGNNERVNQFLKGNPEVVASVLSKMASKEQRKGILKDVGFATSDQILRNLIKEDMEGTGLGIGAQVIANLPGSATANMENVLDAAKDLAGGDGIDADAVMGFLENVSSAGGQTVVKGMLDSTNDNYLAGMLDPAKIALGDGRQAVAEGMNQLLSNPVTAQKVAELQAKGMNDEERLLHQISFFGTAVSGQIKSVASMKGQVSDGELAESMVAMHTSGMDMLVDSGSKDENGQSIKVMAKTDQYNQRDKAEMVNVIESLMPDTARDTNGKRIGDEAQISTVRGALQNQLELANSSGQIKKVSKVHDLARRLGIDLEETAKAVSPSVPAPPEKIVELKLDASPAEDQGRINEELKNLSDEVTGKQAPAALPVLTPTPPPSETVPEVKKKLPSSKVPKLEKKLNKEKAAQGFLDRKVKQQERALGEAQESLEGANNMVSSAQLEMKAANDEATELNLTQTSLKQEGAGLKDELKQSQGELAELNKEKRENKLAQRKKSQEITAKKRELAGLEGSGDQPIQKSEAERQLEYKVNDAEQAKNRNDLKKNKKEAELKKLRSTMGSSVDYGAQINSLNKQKELNTAQIEEIKANSGGGSDAWAEAIINKTTGIKGVDRAVVVTPQMKTQLRKAAKSKDFNNLSQKDQRDLELLAINFAKQAGMTGVSTFMGSVSSQAANQAGMDSASLKQLRSLEKQNMNLDFNISQVNKLKSNQDKKMAEKMGQERTLLKEIGALDSASTDLSTRVKEANDALLKQRGEDQAQRDAQKSAKSSQTNKLKAEISGMETDLGTLKGAGVKLDLQISGKSKEIEKIGKAQAENQKKQGDTMSKINENETRKKLAVGALGKAQAQQEKAQSGVDDKQKDLTIAQGRLSKAKESTSSTLAKLNEARSNEGLGPTKLVSGPKETDPDVNEKSPYQSNMPSSTGGRGVGDTQERANPVKSVSDVSSTGKGGPSTTTAGSASQPAQSSTNTGISNTPAPGPADPNTVGQKVDSINAGQFPLSQVRSEGYTPDSSAEIRAGAIAASQSQPFAIRDQTLGLSGPSQGNDRDRPEANNMDYRVSGVDELATGGTNDIRDGTFTPDENPGETVTNMNVLPIDNRSIIPPGEEYAADTQANNNGATQGMEFDGVHRDPMDDASKTALRDQAMRAGGNSIEQLTGGNTGNVDPSATTGSEGGGGNNYVGTVSSPQKAPPSVNINLKDVKDAVVTKQAEQKPITTQSVEKQTAKINASNDPNTMLKSAGQETIDAKNTIESAQKAQEAAKTDAESLSSALVAKRSQNLSDISNRASELNVNNDDSLAESIMTSVDGLLETDKQITEKEARLTKAVSMLEEKDIELANVNADIKATQELIDTLAAQVKLEKKGSVADDAPTIEDSSTDEPPTLELSTSEKQLKQLEDDQTKQQNHLSNLSNERQQLSTDIKTLRRDRQDLVTKRNNDNDNLNFLLASSEDADLKTLFEEKNMLDTLISQLNTDQKPVDDAIQGLKDVQMAQTEALNKQQVEAATLQSLQSELALAKQQVDDLNLLSDFKDKADQSSTIAKEGALQNIGLVALTTSIDTELPLVEPGVIDDFSVSDRDVSTETFNGLIQDLKSAVLSGQVSLDMQAHLQMINTTLEDQKMTVIQKAQELKPIFAALAKAPSDSDAGKLFKSAAKIYGQVIVQNSAEVEFGYSAEKTTKSGELTDVQAQLNTELETEDSLRDRTNSLEEKRNAAQTQMNQTIDNLEQLKQVKAEDQDETTLQSDIETLKTKITQAERDLQTVTSTYDNLNTKKVEAEKNNINESVDLDTASKGLVETTFELSLIDQDQKEKLTAFINKLDDYKAIKAQERTPIFSHPIDGTVLERLLNTDFSELENKTGDELTSYLKEKGITHDTKNEIFTMINDFSDRLTNSSFLTSQLVRDRFDHALTALYDAANIVDILKLEDSKEPIEEKQRGMRDAVADLANTSEVAKKNLEDVTLEASNWSNKQIDAQLELDSLKSQLSEKEIALQDVKQTQQQIHDLNQILDDQANEFKAFDNDYHTVFNQLQTTSNKVNELREKRNQLTSELTQLVMDEPIPSIFQDTVDRGVSTVKSASEQRCSDLESKIKDMEKALANTMLTIEDGQKKIDSANNELSKAHDAFEQTRFDANAMLNRIQTRPVRKSAPTAKPAPAKQTLSFSNTDQGYLQAARDHVNNYQSGQDLKTTVQDLKFLCRSGVADLRSKMPSGNIDMDKQLQKEINSLNEGIMIIEHFQASAEPNDLDAKLTLLGVLGHPEVLSTEIMRGINKPDNLKEDVKTDFSKINFDQPENPKLLMRHIAELSTLPGGIFNEVIDPENLRMGDISGFVSKNMGLLSKTERLTVASEFLALDEVKNQPVNIRSDDLPELPDSDSLSETSTDGFQMPSMIKEVFQKEVGENLVQMVLNDQLTEGQLIGFESKATDDIKGQEEVVNSLEVELNQLNQDLSKKNKEYKNEYNNSVWNFSQPFTSISNRMVQHESLVNKEQDIESAKQKCEDCQKELSEAKVALAQLQGPRMAKALAVLKHCDASRSEEVLQNLTDQEKATVIEKSSTQALQVLFDHPNAKKTLLGSDQALSKEVLEVRQKQKELSQLNRMIKSFEHRKGFGLTQSLGLIDNLEGKLRNFKNKRNELQSELRELKKSPTYIESKNKALRLQSSIVNRIQKNPELGATLFSKVVTSNTIEDSKGAVIALSSSINSESNLLQLFSQLPRPSQQAVIAEMDNNNVSSMVARLIDADQEISTEGLALLDVVSRTKPDLMGVIMGESMSVLPALKKTLETLAPLSVSDSVGKSDQIEMLNSMIGQLSPSAVQMIAKEVSSGDSILNVTKMSNPKDFQMKQNLKKNNPVGYMTAVMSAVRANPQDAVMTLLNAYDVGAGDAETMSMALKEMGRAGNLNPNLMAQLMDELSGENVGQLSTDQQNRLNASLNMLVQAGDAREHVQLLKEAMAGAMFSENSLDFTLGYASMPMTIKTHLNSFSNRLVDSKSVAPDPDIDDGLPKMPDELQLNPDIKSNFLNQMSGKTKTRFIGLMLDIPTSQLLSTMANDAVNQAMFNKVFADPEKAATLEGLISVMYDPPISSSDQNTVQQLAKGKIINRTISPVGVLNTENYNVLQLRDEISNLNLNSKKGFNKKQAKQRLDVLNEKLKEKLKDVEGNVRSMAKNEAAAFRRKDALITQIRMAKVLYDPNNIPANDLDAIRLMMSFNPMSVPVSKDGQDKLIELSNDLQSRIASAGDPKTASALQSIQSMVCARGYDIMTQLGDRLAAPTLPTKVQPGEGLPTLPEDTIIPEFFLERMGVEYNLTGEKLLGSISSKLRSAKKILTPFRAGIYQEKSMEIQNIVANKLDLVYGNNNLPGLDLLNLAAQVRFGINDENNPLKGFGFIEVGSGINDVNLNQDILLNESLSATDQYVQMDARAFLRDPSLKFDSEGQANVFIQKLLRREPELLNFTATGDVKLAKEALKRFSDIQKIYPHLATPQLKSLEQNVVDQLVQLHTTDSTGFDDVYQSATPEIKQAMFGALQSKSDPAAVEKVAQLKSRSGIDRLTHALQQPLAQNERVTTGKIDFQQREMKVLVEEELTLLTSPQAHKSFYNTVIGNIPKDTNQSIANFSVQMARVRGLQQAINNDRSLSKDEKSELNRTLSDKMMTQLLASNGEAIPLNDRSIDHLVHVIKGVENNEILTSFLAQLESKVGPDGFERIQSRLALHYRIDPSNAHSSSMSKAMSDIKSSKADVPYAVKREAAELSNCKTNLELRSKMLDVVNNDDLPDQTKGQILTDLMVRNPQNYIQAVALLNDLAQNNMPMNLSNALPEMPNDGSETPALPDSNSTDQNKAVSILSESMKQINQDKYGLGMFYSQVYDGVYDRLDTSSGLNSNAWINAGLPYNLIAATGIAVSSVSGAILGSGLYPIGKSLTMLGSISGTIISETGRFLGMEDQGMLTSMVDMQSLISNVRIPDFQKNPLKQAVGILAQHPQGEQEIRQLLSSSQTLSSQFSDMVSYIGEEKFIEMTLTDEALFDKFLDQATSRRDFFNNYSIRNSNTAQLNRMALNLHRHLLGQENTEGLVAKMLLHQTQSSSITFADSMMSFTEGFATTLSSTVDTAYNIISGSVLSWMTGAHMMDTTSHIKQFFEKSTGPNSFKNEMLNQFSQALHRNPEDMMSTLNVLMNQNGEDACLLALTHSKNDDQILATIQESDSISPENKTKLLAMALANNKTLIGGFDTSKMSEKLMSRNASECSTYIAVLNTAINDGFVSNQDLKTMVDTININQGLDSFVMNNLVINDPVSLPDGDDSNRLQENLTNIAKAGDRVLSDLSELLPKMMSSVAKKSTPDDALAILKNVLTSIDIARVQSDIIQSAIPELPEDSMDQPEPISNETVEGEVKVFKSPLESAKEDLKLSLVESMADHIDLSGIDSEIEISTYPLMSRQDEIDTGFAGQILNHLRLTAGTSGGAYNPSRLSGNNRKLHNIYQELKAFSETPNHSNWFSTDSRSTLRSLFKKHGLEPEGVTHLLMTKDQILQSENFMDTFNQTLNQRISDVTYKATRVHKEMKAKLAEARNQILNDQVSSKEAMDHTLKTIKSLLPSEPFSGI